MSMATARIKRSLAVFKAIILASLSLHIKNCFVNAAFLQRIVSPAAGNPSLQLTTLLLKRGGTKKKQDKGSTITVNKLAFRNYEVLEKWEAGIALQGTEVKR